MIKKYKLDFQKAKKYFKENLKDTNNLSNFVISSVNFESGDFFSLLTENATFQDINEFETGGKTYCLREDVSNFIYSLMQSNKNFSCIFDDFNANTKNIEDDLLFYSNGLSHENEIYYVIDKNANLDLILQCLKRSNAIWHSLCILGDFNLQAAQKSISQDELKKVCLNAKLIMIGAYDSESYIIWEKFE